MILLFLFLTAFQSLASREMERSINTITIQGNVRTREDVIRRILPVREGDLYGEDTKEEIIQKLRSTGLFNPEIEVMARETDGKTDILITLKDKWTLIPIPIVSVADQGSWRAGALVIEGNLLGFYKTLGLGFFYGSDGYSLLSFFSSPLLLNTDMTLTAGFSAGFDETEDLTMEEDLLREYQADTLSGSLGLEYPLGQALFFTGGWEYDRSALKEKSREQTGIPDMEFTGLSAELKWKDLYYDIPYETGLLLKGVYSWNWGLAETENFPVIEGKIRGALTPWAGHLIRLDGQYGSGDLPVQKEFRLGGLPGTQVLPMDRITADEYLATSLSYNVPVWTFSGGTISAKAFYEVGFYSTETIERTFFDGPGAGLELFINDLAIPAVTMNFGWNRKTESLQFSAGIGMGGSNPD